MEGCLPASDQRWHPGCPNSVVEIVSQSWDSDRIGVGSSPFVGDMGSLGVRVPGEQNGGQTQRYTYVLCGFEIPGGCGAVIRGLRQLVTLRAEVSTGEGEDAAIRVFEIEQTTPFWSFPDGNVSWHLRWRPNRMNRSRFDAANPPLPGQSTDWNILDTSLVYLIPPDGAAGTYVPPSAGIPPGPGVNNLGCFYDIRWPWHNQPNSHLAIPLRGPGVVQFIASVQQSDPVTRTATPVCQNTSVLSPEDQFLCAFGDAVYGRVAGAITVELFPGGCER